MMMKRKISTRASLIPILRPSPLLLLDTMAFVNIKQFYSINIQAVCDSDTFIANIVARWPGSTHDSRRIFENSKVADKLRDHAVDGILVGNSRCACRAYLIKLAT